MALAEFHSPQPNSQDATAFLRRAKLSRSAWSAAAASVLLACKIAMATSPDATQADHGTLDVRTAIVTPGAAGTPVDHDHADQPAHAEHALIATTRASASVAQPAPVTRQSAAAGELSKAAVHDVIEAHAGAIGACYDRAHEHRPSARVRLKILIEGDGAVRSAAVDQSDLHDAISQRCMTEEARHWKFPAPEHGGIVVVTQSFTLQPNRD